MIVEICANSFESAQAAQLGGADRIELCADLSVGGLTPSRELIKKVIDELEIPVHVLIRPRSGDFCYSEEELESMLEDIKFCKESGCKGVVSGILTTANHIDITATKRLVSVSEGMEFTFHRAFDISCSTSQAITALLNLDVTRLLTSGKQPDAANGIEFLKNLKELSRDKIQIMPGGGINAQNAKLFKETGFDMIHFSATKKEESKDDETDLFSSQVTGHSDQNEIEKIIQLLA